MTRKLNLIITGTGRCATAFYAKYCTSAGLACGHERFFSHDGLKVALATLAKYWTGTRGDSSWLAAPFLDSEPLKDAFVVHLLRHPKDVIEANLRVSPFVTPQWSEFAEAHLPGLSQYRSIIDWAAYHWLHWNEMIERATAGRPGVQFKVEQEPHELLKILQAVSLIDDVDCSMLFDNRKYNTKQGPRRNISPGDIEDVSLRHELLEQATRYGYAWEQPILSVVERAPTIKAIVTTLDNLLNLKESVMVLRDEPLDEIIIVNNGSIDSTQEWLATQSDLTIVNRDNLGAGPGRNAGLDIAGDFDYALLLDGGIRPLRGGTKQMLDYLHSVPKCDVIGIEIAGLETDSAKAWRRWNGSIARAYCNTRLSHTAYCLCRTKAWDGLRFSEEGPFAQPGWGADDDEMAYRWIEAGIIVHVATGIKAYRRASGSFSRLFKETGIYPNQYGSIYEQRVVWLGQNWPQHEPIGQWGEPWLTVVIQADSVENTARMIKSTHNQLRKRRFKPPWDNDWNPYHVVAWGGNDDFLTWAEPRRLCQHHGNAIVVDGEIVRRNDDNEKSWTGDFILSNGADWRAAVRPTAHYYGLVANQDELDMLLVLYEETYPHQLTKKLPEVQRWQL